MSGGEPVPTGKVLLKISAIGDVLIELWPKECPKACRNFVQLCLEGYYDGCLFHRLVPNFLCQTGDPTGTGRGGESIYDEGPFADEISQRLRFNRRGIVGMANQGKRNTNNSQFFISLDRADALNGNYTAFGTVTGDTIYNLIKFNELEMDPKRDEKPLYPPSIRSAEVLENPFDDIKPRITAAERKEQVANRKEMRERAKLAAKRGKGVKNAGLLSFEADAEDSGTAKASKGGMKSAHDLLNDAKLSAEVKDDRGFSAKLPDSFLDMPTSVASSSKEKKSAIKSNPEKDDAFRPPPRVEKPQKENKTVSEPSQAEKRKAEIEALQSELLGTRNRRNGSASDSDGEKAKSKKAKKSDLDGAALLAAQRAAYIESGKAQKGKKRAAEPSIHPDRASKVARKDTDDDRTIAANLDGFRTDMREARKVAAVEEKLNPKVSVLDQREIGYMGEILEEDSDGDDNDMSFLTHKLKFRKDVTADQAKYNDYVTLDPREQGLTLEDAKAEDERRRRKGQIRTGGDAGDPRAHSVRNRQDAERRGPSDREHRR